MRTTLTLDDDLVRRLKEVARRSGESFKSVVNTTIRRGLEQAGKPQDRLPRFVVEPKACGLRAGVDPRKLNRLVDELEIESFERQVVGETARR